MDATESGRWAYLPLLTGDPVAFLTNAAATYYTVPTQPTNAVAMLRGLVFCNITAAVHTVRVHIVDTANGDTAATSNAIMFDVTIAAKTTLQVCFDDSMIIPAGCTLQALADGNSVITITGSVLVAHS